MSTQLAPNQQQAFTQLLAQNKRAIESVLPKHLTPERMLRLALVAANQNPKILECTPTSVIQCLVTASSLGLDVSGSLGSAYLVPYGKQCTLIVGYRGLLTLIRRSGEIRTIEAHCVYERDRFEYQLGLDPKLSHTPHMGEDRGECIAAYAIAWFKDGAYQVEVMSRHDLDKIRKGSRAANSGPWVDHTDEMRRKTVTRRLAKWLPMSVDLQRATTFEDEGVDVQFSLDDGTPPKQTESASKSTRVAAALGVETNGSQDSEPLPAETDPDGHDPAAAFSQFKVQSSKHAKPADLPKLTAAALEDLGMDADAIDFDAKTCALSDEDVELVVSQIAQGAK